MPNPFELLRGSDDEGEEGEEGTVAPAKKTQAAPAAAAAAAPKGQSKAAQNNQAQKKKPASAPVQPVKTAVKSLNMPKEGPATDSYESGEKSLRGGRVGGTGRGRSATRNDRQSRAPRSQKGSEKKDGHGAANWGSNQDVVREEQTGIVDDDTKAAAEDGAAAKAEGEAEGEAAPAEPEEKQLTLEEYEAQRKAAIASKVPQLPTARKAGEGDAAAKAGEIRRKEDLDDNKEEKSSERKAQRANQKEFVNVEVRFSRPESGDDRRGGGRGRGRGGRGRGRGGDRPQGDRPQGERPQSGRGGFRGGRGGRGGQSRQGGSDTVFSDSDFPKL